jgi:hypothetical protein
MTIDMNIIVHYVALHSNTTHLGIIVQDTASIRCEHCMLARTAVCTTTRVPMAYASEPLACIYPRIDSGFSQARANDLCRAQIWVQPTGPHTLGLHTRPDNILTDHLQTTPDRSCAVAASRTMLG